MINRQTVTDRLGVIILTLHELAAAHIAHTLFFGGDVHNVIAGAAVLADPSAAHSGDDLFIGDFDGDHSVEADTGLLHGLGLGDGAGHAVQNIAIGAIGLLPALIDDADDNLIRHQLACVHVLLGLQAGGSAVFHGCTQNVTRRDGRDIQLDLENVSLGPLTGTRGT